MPENELIVEETIDQVKEYVYDKLKKTLEDIRGGKLYIDLVKELELINETEFQYLIDLQIAIRSTNQRNLWEINNEMHDLSLLSITFSPAFYDTVLYPKVALKDIKMLQTNLLTMTKWLFSNNRSENGMPILMKECSPKLRENFPKFIDCEIKDEQDIIVLKNDMICALADILVQASFNSVYHKPIPKRELQNLEWQMN